MNPAGRIARRVKPLPTAGTGSSRGSACAARRSYARAEILRPIRLRRGEDGRVLYSPRMLTKAQTVQPEAGGATGVNGQGETAPPG
jgi:hypothetical protein